MTKFRSWWSFIRFMHSVKHASRYVRTSETQAFLDALVETSAKRHRFLKLGHVLWRAQLGSAVRRREVAGILVENPAPFAKARMKPPVDSAHEGRVNPKGIPVLYAATDKKTAMTEVRPWVGSHISLGRFELTRDVTLIDFSGEDDSALRFYPVEPDALQREKVIWAQVGQSFAMPISNEPSTAEYVPTQVIAEIFRARNLDGIVYKSSLGPGRNVALFDLAAAKLTARFLHEVEAVSLTFSRPKRLQHVKGKA